MATKTNTATVSLEELTTPNMSEMNNDVDFDKIFEEFAMDMTDTDFEFNFDMDDSFNTLVAPTKCQKSDNTETGNVKVKPITEPKMVVEKVKLISEQELTDIKNDIIFRLTDSTSGDRFTFSKVCNISRFDANSVFVILYLNEKGKDRNSETAGFVDCKEEDFFTPAKVFISSDILKKYNPNVSYQKRGEHFGKISLKLAKK